MIKSVPNLFLKNEQKPIQHKQNQYNTSKNQYNTNNNQYNTKIKQKRKKSACSFLSSKISTDFVWGK
jgi:hypothetical protein